jgi:thiol-disulfide isomerase/thioredoxin
MQSNRTESTPSSWTEPQLQEVLYQWDTEASPVIEYPLDGTNHSILVFPHDTNQVTFIVEFYAPWCPHCQEFKAHYVNLAKKVTRRSIDSSTVLFYAVSCTLHADLCAHYEIEGFPTLMAWGPSLPRDVTLPGFPLNSPDSPSITPDHVAQLVGVELAQDTHKLNKTTSTNESHQDDDYYYDDVEIPTPQDALQMAHQAALRKIYSYHYLHPKVTTDHNATISLSFEYLWINTKNYRFHDAAQSLIFLLQNALSMPVKTIDGGNATDHSSMHGPGTAFLEFLFLIDWASPPTWNVRTSLMDDLLDELLLPKSNTPYLWNKPDYLNSTNTNPGGWWKDIPLKHKLEQIIQRHVHEIHNKTTIYSNHENLSDLSTIHTPWGFVLPLNSFYYPSMASKWSPVCSHIYSHSINNITNTWNQPIQPMSRTAGYTCGLWQLFHILTIGASLPQQQIYGHLMGYKTSSYDVAKTIKLVIEYFFGCDVCRNNFVHMYNTCGHNHCNRFTPQSQPLFLDTRVRGTIRKTEPFDRNLPSPQGKDLVLWLWEVHNSVNVRLMNEHAVSEKRSITAEESVAGKFPTKIMCPLCWKDSKSMSHPNHDQVYAFLREMYWPGYSIPPQRGKPWLHAVTNPMTASATITSHKEQLWTYRTDEGGEPIGFFGFFCVTIPLILILCLFIRKTMSMDDFEPRFWRTVYKRGKTN